MHCGCPVRARLERLQAEEEARRLEAQREKERELSYIILGVIGAIIFIVIAVTQSQHQPSTGTSLYQMSEQTQSLTPGVNTFSASGKLKLDYSCQANSKNMANVQLVLMNTDNSTIVWKKAMDCPARGSDTIQVKSGNYDVGASVNGNANWTMNVIQQ